MKVETELIPFHELKLPDTLYKYRDFNDSDHLRLISHREVYYSSPDKFEDKLDCKNPSRWDLVTQKEILNKYFDDVRENHPHLADEDQMQMAYELAQNTQVTNPDFVAKRQEETFKSFDLRTGILCLTAYPGELKMWEKYGTNHTGFCVGFDPKVMLNGLGSGGGEVDYVEELPDIHPIKDSHLIQSTKQIFKKIDIWNFEKEYRSYIFRNRELIREDRIVKVPAEGIKEIILGAAMPETNERKLLAIIPKELRHIKIKKVVIYNGNITIINKR
jgi:hypothetical protein